MEASGFGNLLAALLSNPEASNPEVSNSEVANPVPLETEDSATGESAGSYMTSINRAGRDPAGSDPADIDPAGGYPAVGAAVGSPDVASPKSASSKAALSNVFSSKSEGAETNDNDVVETAVAAGSFTILAAALEAANLVNVLKGEGPFTVFAPTDEAFNTLPAGTLASLLQPENKEKLRSILACHVVAGVVTAEYAMKLSSAQTLNGQKLGISTQDGTVMVNNARVVKADIPASNGVIHVIDTVILPKSN